MTRSLAIFAAVLFTAAVAAASDIKPEQSTRTKGVAAELWALGELESGNCDGCRGQHHEVSRYQCLPSVWRTTTLPIQWSTNTAAAAIVVLDVIFQRTKCDPAQLTPELFARAWHCPGARHLNREQRDYAARFCNLVAAAP
jgi:hypothetical protein